MINNSWKELALALANENHNVLCRFFACNCGCVERRSEITLDINKKAQEELEGP
jgi:hypothetical protein